MAPASHSRPWLRLVPSPALVSRTLLLVLACFLFLIRPAKAVRIPFENCLPDSYKFNDPVPLQWNPLYADARFDTESENHNLRVIIWGNVTGSHFEVPLPPPGDPRWEDSAESDGKIVRIPDEENAKVTSLKTQVEMLTYSPFGALEDFCNNKLVNASCPLAPIFNRTDVTNPYELPSVNISHDFFSSYAFASFSATFLVIYGNAAATDIGCVSATITPDLGHLAGLIKWMPFAILLFVGFATIFASTYSPWGTTDVLRWTSNFGRDQDLLRLVTPGFGDCLQYIQFVVLTGSLTLNYPGFYQPIVSQASWSALMFNESFVDKSPGWQAIQDGIYVTGGHHGLERFAHLVGMGDVEDIWVGMMVWLLVIIASLLVLIQLGFFVLWVYRLISSTTEEDLRAKNLPFSIGNVVRVVFNFFLLPIVALSTFQLVVAGESAGFAVALAVITLVILIGFTCWLLYLIITTKPRAVLFDDLPTVLLYGPLYNTYSDESATFALVPVMLTFFRGIAIGAVQPFGIAQIVMLAICEVVQVLTLHAFRPFHPATFMNAYHTMFSIVRFVTVMLMVPFIPELGVTEGPKGWIGYAILIIHAGIIVLGFFLNALQTCVEVIAGLLGAGGESGLARGGLAKIFGMRQLQRRTMARRNGPSRQSTLSSTAMLDADEVSKAGYMPSGRVRSESQGSAFLLRSQQRSSSVLDTIDTYSAPHRNLDSSSNFTPTTPGEASPFSFLPSPGGATRPQPAMIADPSDPYYRPPRRRGDTLTGSIMSDRRRVSIADSRRYSQLAPQPTDSGDLADAQPADQADAGAAPTQIPISLLPRADYATREVDFYYGVRGPALNSEAPGRKLGTGPADPTGPMASAAGWFRTMLGGKTKEKGKGFEVVRSARMPTSMRAPGGEFSDNPPPEGIPVAMGVLRNGPIDSDDDEPTNEQKKAATQTGAPHDDLLTGDGEPRGSEDSGRERSRVSEVPPALPGLDYGDSFHLPSRAPSKASRQASQRQKSTTLEVDPEFEIPDIPRKSSKRHSQVELGHSPTPSFKLVPPTSPSRGQQNQQAIDLSPNRLPFERTESQRRLSGSSMDASDLSQVDLSGSPDERPTSFGMAPTRPNKKNKKQQQIDPRNMDPKLLLDAAAVKLEEGDLENALGAATAALKATGPGGDLELLCTNLIGQIYVEAGEVEDARAAFTRAVALDEDGSADEARGGGPEKFLWLAQLSEDGGRDSVGWFERGAASLRGQIQALDGVARKTPEQEALLEERKRKLAGTLCGVAEVYMTDLSWESDAEQRCEALVTEATLVAPGLAEAWQTVANVRISQEKVDEARAALGRSLDIWRGLPVTHPDVPDFPTRVSLARLLLEVEMEEESIEVLEKLVGDDDESVEAWYLGGWGQYISGEKLKQLEAEGRKADNQEDDWRTVWRSARQWLAVCLKLFEQQEYEDEKLGEHAKQLFEAITKELGPAAENEADEVWEDNSDDEDEDEEMAG
ncbi:hypothetical protein ACHAQH_001705 [Verticillium albo-atrum]